MLFSGLQILESTVFSPRREEAARLESKKITRGGVDYYPRQDITVVMLLGIDQNGPVTASGSYNNPGAADMVALLIFDEKNETYSVLGLNRDAMVTMPVLGIGGKPAGTQRAQLALSHTQGSGLEDSCENTRTTVSELLYGLQIDYYFSMNMDAIAILNDAVGGVTVNVKDDFSAIDPTITKGQVTLRGQQAIHYVRTRRGVGDQLNLSRMDRQEEYISGFLAAMQTKAEQSESFILSAYEKTSPYIVTDVSVKQMSNLFHRFAKYEYTGMTNLEGKNVLTEEFYEFHIDEQKLDELILKLFYAPK
jgi:LCP family protein required for cell wall assembly